MKIRFNQKWVSHDEVIEAKSKIEEILAKESKFAQNMGEFRIGVTGDKYYIEYGNLAPYLKAGIEGLIGEEYLSFKELARIYSCTGLMNFANMITWILEKNKREQRLREINRDINFWDIEEYMIELATFSPTLKGVEICYESNKSYTHDDLFKE